MSKDLWSVSVHTKDGENYIPVAGDRKVGQLRWKDDRLVLETLNGTVIAQLREAEELQQQEGGLGVVGRADTPDPAADRTPGGSRWQMGQEVAWLCEPLPPSLAPASREEMEHVFHFRSGIAFLRDSARMRFCSVDLPPGREWLDNRGRSHLLTWAETSGELYLYCPARGSAVHVLAILETENEAREVLATEADHPLTIDWLCRRLAGHPGADALLREEGSSS